jgi:hypothetical protein
LLLRQTAEAMRAGQGRDGTGGEAQQQQQKQQKRRSGNSSTPPTNNNGLSVRGVLDLRPVLDACELEGLCLTARQLEGVAATLEAAYAAKAQAEEEAEEEEDAAAAPTPRSSLRFPALAALAARIDPSERDHLLHPIRSAVRLGSLSDDASPELKRVRTERRENMASTRALVSEIAKKLHATGASEVKEPVVAARGRLAVSVRAGQSGSVPGGAGVRLGQSSTGATLYVEPRGAVRGNNREAELRQQEEDEEAKVLRALSRRVAARAPMLRAMLDACAELDVVAARAAHARWCRGVRPEFVFAEEERGGDGPSSSSPFDVRALRHPLLLEPSLPPLPPPPARDDDAMFAAAADAAALAAAAGEGGPAAALAAAPNAAPRPVSVSAQGVPSWGLGLPGVAGTITKRGSAAAAAAAGDGEGDTQQQQQQRAPPPRPIDFVVPAGGGGGGGGAGGGGGEPATTTTTRVVAITGPNTGGKTATLKAVGLAALMAKAGMFLPLEVGVGGENGGSGSGGGGGDGGSNANPPPLPPRLAWFDRVLADIGDAQSLQQSLSTFGGHVRRLRGVLSAATPGSLVLLDEVGSGTDPQEGAALARAVLDRLAATARLTVGTTHHAELKLASREDARYAPAAMGFDASTLRPTYSLRWGRTGDSNALDVAEAIGFDASVVKEARALAAAEQARQQRGEREGERESGGSAAAVAPKPTTETTSAPATATTTTTPTTMAGVAKGVEAEILAAERQLAARAAERERREAEVSRLRGLTAELMRVRRTLQGESDALLRREAAGMALRLHDRLRAARRAPVALPASASAPAASGQPSELRELEREFARWEALVRERVEADYGPGGFVGRIRDGEEAGEGGGGSDEPQRQRGGGSSGSTSSSSSSSPPIRVGDYVHVTRLGALGYGRVTRVSRGKGGKGGGKGGNGASSSSSPTIQLRVRTALMGMEARATLDEVLRLDGPPGGGFGAAELAAFAAAEEAKAQAAHAAAASSGGEEDGATASSSPSSSPAAVPGMGPSEAALLMRVDDALSSSMSSPRGYSASEPGSIEEDEEDAAGLAPPPPPSSADGTLDVSREPSPEMAAGAVLDALDEAAAAAATSGQARPLSLRVRHGKGLRAAVRAAVEAAAADEDEEEEGDGVARWRLLGLSDEEEPGATLVRFAVVVESAAAAAARPRA